ncbi:putative phage repressor [Pandoraea communis]|uniref:Putative phage repressor n=1 Tax=Pandoraea communis TaxID=2508297 RepID=A0A5E4YYK6_9BURK|nr:LexA family transcriptional regulator [Pandoraea communis]VVE53170.1 putative phage repressor [Pandoraea communis]
MATKSNSSLQPWQIEDAARLKSLFSARTSLSQAEFGAEFGIGSQGMVWQYLNGRRSLNSKAAAAFARGLGITISDFSPTLAKEAMDLTAHISPALRVRTASEDAALRQDIADATMENDGDALTMSAEMYARLRLTNEVEIPRFDARGSMGGGFPMPDHDRVIETIRVTRTWLRDTLPSLTNVSNLALLPAFGDSMEGTFNDGDLLWVDRGIVQVKTDAVYVLALQDELYVKRLQRRPDGTILMISDNKKYEPYLIQNGEREKFRVLGRVVYAWRGVKL